MRGRTSCPYCVRNFPLRSDGYHALGRGQYSRCEAVKEELDKADVAWKSLVGVYPTYQGAVRKASQVGVALLVIPSIRKYWAVVREEEK